MGTIQASNDDQLLPIRQLVLFKERLKLNNDPKMAANEKSQKVQAIDDQLAELNRAMDAIAAAKTN